ncbi:MAG: pirin family protein [Deltaproteobacteria bacterium]|jgi:redox-sensitive bicupin YhaK (pirin superfamily)|nr:pirin family protein [Deltaproteobacteria bacterium]
MSSTRKIKTVSKSKPTIEGAGVHLKRAFGYYQVPHFDPFLLLDDFRSADPAKFLPGFPWHPHRGIETITYVVEGRVEHGDSMGNKGDITVGDVQWMTAGSGIIHQEMPKGNEAGRMGGFQLWANLPASMKMMEPRYRDVRSEQIPEVTLDKGIKVRIICGEINGVRGPVRDIVINPQYLDVTVPAGSTFSHPVEKGHTAFAYVTGGKGYFDDDQDAFSHEVVGRSYFDLNRECICGDGDLILYEDGDRVSISAKDSVLRFLLVSGRPIGEPVAWYGPIVMNTQEELRIAFDEYRGGTFIKHKNPVRD